MDFIYFIIKSLCVYPQSTSHLCVCRGGTQSWLPVWVVVLTDSVLAASQMKCDSSHHCIPHPQLFFCLLVTSRRLLTELTGCHALSFLLKLFFTCGVRWFVIPVHRLSSGEHIHINNETGALSEQDSVRRRPPTIQRKLMHNTDLHRFIHPSIISTLSFDGGGGGAGASQLTLDRRWDTPCAGHQLITGPTYRDNPPFTLTFTSTVD